MGWTYFHKPKGAKVLDTIKEHCFSASEREKIVAASATFGAVHVVYKVYDPESNVYVPDAEGFVKAILVFKLGYAPSDHHNFGYKDMSETSGPYDCECAPSIIAAASELRDPIGPEPEYSSLKSAREYRERSLAKSKAKSAKRSLKEGAKVKLAKALSFGGIELDEFIVERARVRGRKGRGTYFRSVKTGGLCNISASHLSEATIS